MANIYATTSSIITTTPWLKDNTATAAVITERITEAQGIIDGKLARRYSVPFSATAVPPAIRSICRSMVRGMTVESYATYERHIDNALLEYQRGLDQLQQYQDREADLINTAGSLISEKRSDIFWSSTEDYENIVDLDDESNWAMTEDQADDIEDKRDKQ